MNAYLSAVMMLQTASMPQDIHGPVVEVDRNQLDILVGNELQPAAWTLALEAQPDSMSVTVDEDDASRACLLAGAASFCREVSLGEVIDFTIRYDGKDYWTQFIGTPSQAVFDATYQEAHRDKISIVSPAAYELVNVAIALTDTAQSHPCMIYAQGNYYEALQAYFADYRDHALVTRLNQAMTASLGNYFPIKMSGYSYRFDENAKLVPNTPYNSTNFTGQPNALAEGLPLLQDFADTTDFLAFYRAHQAVYDGQVADMREGIGIPQMVEWLRDNFPNVAPYDHVRVVMSPLANCMQSVTWMESRGFREIQPHMNYPYPYTSATLGEDEIRLQRGGLVFTELNHGFINPTAEPFAERIVEALADREFWTDGGQTTGSYGSPTALFNEYMNWGLIDLYNWDQLEDHSHFEELHTNTKRIMKDRGFVRFDEFSDFLLDLYRNRPEGTRLERLYPQIVAWFEAQNPA